MPRQQRTKVSRVCEYCGGAFLVWPSQIIYNKVRFCSPTCYHMARTKSLHERFLQYCATPDANGCVLWTGARMGGGYGSIADTKLNTSILAHRFAYEYVYGKIATGMFICHKCDNRLCVNVHHLFVGTHDDNMRDMTTKQRQANGERRPHKLTEAEVKDIRIKYASGTTQDELALAHSVAQTTISKIVRRQKWKHVQ